MKSLMNFSDSALSRTEMKMVKGGCGIHIYKNGSLVQTWTGYSMAEAKKLQKQKNGLAGNVVKWCCAHC
jgi:hypothetical protein